MEHREVVLSFDPGWCTGIFLGWFNDETALTRTGYWAVPGGAQGVSDWLRTHATLRPDHVVSELFVPDGSPGARETVAPRVEGVLIQRFGEGSIAWQQRSEKAWAGSIEKGDDHLKRLGWWVTGSQVCWTDGRDSNDAALHSLQYMRKRHHRPTLVSLYGEAPTT